MKVKSFFTKISIVLFISLFFLSCSENTDSKKVVVYAYDSFVADWGPAPQLEKLFEAKTGLDLVFISVGDSGQVLSRAILEKENPNSDILLGIDNHLFDKAIKENVLQEYTPKNTKDFISEELWFKQNSSFSEWVLTPYDWSTFAIMFDSLATEDGVPLSEPKSLSDLTKREYNKKLILMDPRTSTPGLGFVAWTVSVFGDDYLDFWKNLKESILTMSPGWDTGYGLFTSGEAPLVISYTSSEPYHIECDNTNRYKALYFEEGHAVQVEGAAITKNAKNVEGAKKFLDFLISEEAQAIIPTTQWMYPVNKNIILPECFSTVKMPKILPNVDSEILNDAVVSILQVLSSK